MFLLLAKSHKFDYDEQDERGKTILHYACKTNNFDLIQTIISLGAVTTIKDNKGLTILHYACKQGNFDIVSFLVSRDEFTINEKDKKGRTPYAYALLSEENRVIKYLEGLPGIDLTIPNDDSDTIDDDDADIEISSDSIKMEKEEEEEAKLDSKDDKKEKKIDDKKSQFEYGKKLFMKGIKYLKISKQNGSEESLAFVIKYIKDLNIGGIETLNESEEKDHDD